MYNFNTVKIYGFHHSFQGHTLIGTPSALAEYQVFVYCKFSVVIEDYKVGIPAFFQTASFSP